ncbi:MAG: hypothetical protein UW64_C0003G0078, partial [Microgenomates group bacterium GW2011_GWC1_44_37]
MYYDISKRIVDIIGAIIMGILFLP